MDVSLLPLLTKHRIIFRPKFLTTNPMPGRFASPYSGQGPEVLSLRVYQPGDDIRRIRLGESLRAGKKIVGEHAELRDVFIVVAIDCSASMMLREKWEAERRVASLLLYSAWKAESSFALAVGSSQFTRPSSGERQFQLAYKTLYDQERIAIACDCKNDWTAFCREIRERVPERSMIFILSDFLGPINFLTLPASTLRDFSNRYDTIAVCLQDDLEYAFPVLGYDIAWAVEDAETGQQQESWLSQRDQMRIRQKHQGRFVEIHEQARSAGMGWLHIAGLSLQEIDRSFSLFFEQRKLR